LKANSGFFNFKNGFCRFFWLRSPGQELSNFMRKKNRGKSESDSPGVDANLRKTGAFTPCSSRCIITTADEGGVNMLESKTVRVWLGATLLLCAISYRQALSAQEVQHSIAKALDTYRIGVGDRIQVDIWQHPELTNTVVVDGSGNITLPSVHEVKVSGLPATDVASLVRYKLERKIPNPQVAITVVRVSNRDSPSPDLRQGCCVAQEGPSQRHRLFSCI
jgi:hypothetical protein